MECEWDQTLIGAASNDDDRINSTAPSATGGLPLEVVRTSVDRPNLAFHVRSKDGLSPDEVCALIAQDIGSWYFGDRVILHRWRELPYCVPLQDMRRVWYTRSPALMRRWSRRI